MCLVTTGTDMVKALSRERDKNTPFPLYLLPVGVLLITILVISTFLVFFSPFNDSQYAAINGNQGGTLPDLIQMNETPLYRITNFSLPGVDGKNHSLSEYQGKIIILDLMATWCEPCKEVYRTIHEVLPLYPDVFPVTISVSPSTDNLDNLRTYAQQQDITWPLLLDGELEVANQTETLYIPHVMVVKVLDMPDPEGYWGYVHYSAIGAPSTQSLSEGITFTKNIYETSS